MAKSAVDTFHDYCETIGDRQPTDAERATIRSLWQAVVECLTPENGCVCPVCGRPVVYGEPQKYETLGEHASDPNGDSPVRKTVRCVNPKCDACKEDGWWGCEEGGWYGGHRSKRPSISIPDIIKPFERGSYDEEWRGKEYHRNGQIKQPLKFRLKMWWARQAARLGAYYTQIDYHEAKTIVVWKKRVRRPPASRS